MNHKPTLLTFLLLLFYVPNIYALSEKCLTRSDSRISFSFLMGELRKQDSICIDYMSIQNQIEVQDFLKAVLNKPVSRAELVEYELSEMVKENATHPVSNDPCSIDPRHNDCNHEMRNSFYAEGFKRAARKQIDGIRSKQAAARTLKDPNKCTVQPNVGRCRVEDFRKYKLELLMETFQMQLEYYDQSSSVSNDQSVH